MAQTARKRRPSRKKKKTVCRSPKKTRRRVRASVVRQEESAYTAARRRRRRKTRVCRPKRRPRAQPPATTPVDPPAVAAEPPPPPPIPESPPQPASPIAVYSGPWGRAQAERLLWRAGFGPAPGWVDSYQSAGLVGAVHSLTRPVGAPVLNGPAPVHDNPPLPIEPADAYGHDHVWFLDRMIRSNQPLVERMTLIWHDWFATSQAGVDSQQYMLDQNELFRRNALGSFHTLLNEVTVDRAMLIWLNGIENRRNAINENYAREVMELFTLGADRGAYSETDVRQLAKALTGWRADWVEGVGLTNFRFDSNRFDSSTKTLFAEVSGYGPKTGNFGWQDAVRLCVEHPLHPSFLVTKLWSYFIPTPPSASDRQALETYYVQQGYRVGPLVEAILLHPDLYQGPRMVKPPVVLTAGILRALGRYIDSDAWWWLSDGAGQFLFRPPDVSGWDDSRWLDTGTVRARWVLAEHALRGRRVSGSGYPVETAQQAFDGAMAYWGNPDLTAETRASLLAFSSTCISAGAAAYLRAYRQNALRQLIVSGPDYQTS